jgi:hypothetical protein
MADVLADCGAVVTSLQGPVLSCEDRPWHL